MLAAPRLIRRNVQSWTTVDNMADAFGWVRKNLPHSTTCIFPLDRQDAFARAEVPQVVNWQAIPYDRLGEWKKRVDQLVGGASYFDGDVWRGGRDIRTAFDSLTLGRSTALRQVRRSASSRCALPSSSAHRRPFKYGIPPLTAIRTAATFVDSP